MKIVVVGLGSMGRRRIRLIKKIKPDADIIGIDSNSERMEFVQNEYGIKGCGNLEEQLKDGDIACAVISTSPVSHADLIRQCLEYRVHVFSELNLVKDRYLENIQLADKMNRVLFLSSTCLYRAEIQYLTEKLKNYKGKVNYIYHVGQYLPDWHPWENYKDFFVGKRETSGCREIFAVELPWIVDAFGEIEKIQVLTDRITDLNIDYDDNYMVLIQHKTGNKGMLAVDVLSRKAVRNLEVYGQQIYLTWDGTPDGLKEYDWKKKAEKSILLYGSVDTVEGYSSFIIENAYERELRAFFDAVENGEKAKYSFQEDLHILDWIDRIEKNV
ncbi:MAG TPA: oxidoreductase [Lachnospiraceae bacterium]|nr:oxidoreductase [Lachnospiraceae bacterium]